MSKDSTPSLEDILYKLKNAHNIAFNEIDPHSNNMSPYDGSKAVSERAEAIEAKAEQELLKWRDTELAQVLDRLEKHIKAFDKLEGVDLMEGYEALETILIDLSEAILNERKRLDSIRQQGDK